MTTLCPTPHKAAYRSPAKAQKKMRQHICPLYGRQRVYKCRCGSYHTTTQGMEHCRKERPGREGLGQAPATPVATNNERSSL